MLNSLVEFPDFIQVKNKKHKKTVHNSSNPAEDSSTVDSVSSRQSVSSEKYHICKNILEGGQCPYGNKCNYAHFEDEWYIQRCSHGIKCNRIKGEKCKNVDPKNICHFIHPHEDNEMFYKRLKIDKKKITRPSKEEISKTKHFTKMCDSFFLEVECNKPSGTCTYAHDQDQLLVKDCFYEEHCHHITFENNIYSTKESIICMYKHPDETFENYKKRVLEPRRILLLQKKDEEKVSVQKVETEKGWGDIMEEETGTKEGPKEAPKEGTKEVDKTNAWNTNTCLSKELLSDKEPVKDIVSNKIIIQVPERMAMDILKVMLEKGEKNFELKII